MTATIADQMEAANQALHGLDNNPALRDLVAEFGYGPAKFAQGQQLFDAAQRAFHTKGVTLAEAMVATRKTAVARTAAWAAYQRVATVARAITTPSDPLLLGHLGLNRAMPRAANDFVAAAKQLFDGIATTPEIATLLGQYGYGPARIATEQAHIQAYRDALQTQQSATALARRATRSHQIALQTLMRWVAQFWKIASVAFYDDPAFLINIGSHPRRRRSNRKDAEDAENEDMNRKDDAQRAPHAKTGEIKKVEALPVEVVAEDEAGAQAGEDDQKPPIQQQE